MIIEAWKRVDSLCKNYILSTLEDDLYNVYSVMATSKELWDALEKKYNTRRCMLEKFCGQKDLRNVLHIPTIRKNLVFAALLVKNGFKCVVVSHKDVISKNEMFLGKSYLIESHF